MELQLHQNSRNPRVKVYNLLFYLILIDKKQAFSVTPNANTLKLKITKVPELGNQSATPSNKNSKKYTLKNFASEINTKAENVEEKGNDDRSTEISSNMSAYTKVEDANTLMKSKPLLNHNGKELLGGIQLPSDIEEFIHHNSGILNNFQFPTIKKIGTLTVEERRIKIEKYLQKRKKRTWSKKISYDCRKRVADSRLRIKGRFVTKEQAFAMLGADALGRDISEISTSEIKNLLNAKFGASSAKKKDSKDKEKPGEKKSETKNEEEEEDDGKLYCLCQRPYKGELMIGIFRVLFIR